VGVEIDLCFGCQAFWFDNLESPGLAEAAVLDLFKEIHEHRDQPRRPVGGKLSCPRCRTKLARTRDILRGNPIEYERCPQGDGRFTTFFQFLREKQFVRSLTPAERTELSAHVGTVRCSSCGAAVSLEQGACSHCGAAISVLDAEAVGKRLVAKARPAAARPPKSVSESWRRPAPEPASDSLQDLLFDSIDSLAGWLSD